MESGAISQDWADKLGYFMKLGGIGDAVDLPAQETEWPAQGGGRRWKTCCASPGDGEWSLGVPGGDAPTAQIWSCCELGSNWSWAAGQRMGQADATGSGKFATMFTADDVLVLIFTLRTGSRCRWRCRPQPSYEELETPCSAWVRMLCTAAVPA